MRKFLMSNEDFRIIAEFSGITEQSSEEDFAHFVGTFKDAAEYGMASGCMPAFIYTKDNVRFFDLHRDRIAMQVFEVNEVNLCDLCDQNSISEADVVRQSADFKNFLVWAYIECIGSELIDEFEAYLNK